MDPSVIFIAILVAIWFSFFWSSDRRAFQDLLTRWTSVEGGEVNEVKTVSNESLEIWRSFINLLALLGELYALFQFSLSIAFPLPLQKPLLLQWHVSFPLLASIIVRFMSWKYPKLSYEQIQVLAVILNCCAILNRVDVPKHLISVNFMTRTFIGAFSACPGLLLRMNLLSAPLAFALEWHLDRSGGHDKVDLVHALANETMSIALMSVLILHLSAVLQNQEMATKKLQKEIGGKEKIVKETDSLLGATRRLLSVTCDCLVQLSHDWKLKEADRSVKDMLKLSSKNSPASLHFAQFIAPEDHDRFSTFIRTSDSDAPSSLHLKLQDTKGSSFHVQLFHVEIPKWLSDGQANDAPKEHLLGLIRQELKEPSAAEEDPSSLFGAFSSIPEGKPWHEGSSSTSSRQSSRQTWKKDEKRKAVESGHRGWPKLDTVKLVLDMNTAEHGYSIRSIQVDLLESCPEVSLLKFVKRKYRAVVEDWMQEHMNCWFMQTPCDERCLGCKLAVEGIGGILVREMKVIDIHQVQLAQEVPQDVDKLDYTLLMSVEMKNFLTTP